MFLKHLLHALACPGGLICPFPLEPSMRSIDYSRRTGCAQLPILLVILVVGAAVAIWFWSRPRTQPSPDQGRKIAINFLDQVRSGHPAEAWEATTAEFKSAQGKESFVQSMKSDPNFKEPVAFVSMQTVTVQEMPRSEYVFRSENGHTLRIVIGKEGGQWKVDRLLK
jgi:hypothetical protein